MVTFDLQALEDMVMWLLLGAFVVVVIGPIVAAVAFVFIEGTKHFLWRRRHNVPSDMDPYGGPHLDRYVDRSGKGPFVD